MASTPTDEPGIAALAMQAVDDAKRWARAEVAYGKALAAERGKDAGIGVGLAVAALAIAQAALAALLVGLVLTLAPQVGAGVATLIVVIAALIVVAFLGWLGVSRIRRAFGGAA
ncbi:hypothetical protein COC42_00175 [Sphingomonas spermidinifaciens]|uniref:Phage holin family protein n=1 Tax=Sphingomonas spermidinifaciens TaxID=1141889 RepID=A0A2A4B139_9SPHN|nr:phage holin family protein [Sphingomonas spermidinifaciens]PCD02903.1 hypothetical protein COC42_00175 [Sphingomonas spermidinifaciens]